MHAGGMAIFLSDLQPRNALPPISMHVGGMAIFL
eukprot:CAMPEP_0201979164 /NCGR_PEP_ID=MMETSP0904-20121228/66525_1 /ASSEMBLY_ACC=CAM_ASM_000553 /TAXON_ID=420261 /ORGANISM="Thalassiosira antarctica, Strain CCMP982" /LENGTH=33 /DNA_ID= /DNA_START= /DNA_END= /DNA_ORIENTATION=